MSIKSLFIFINYLVCTTLPADEERLVSMKTAPVENYATAGIPPREGQNVRIVFYNVENLYDPYDDTLTLDEEFTTNGQKHWSYSRFQAKLNHLSKTLIATGGWDPPAVVGLCEVENRYVLNKLIYQTPLKKYGYRMVHYDSPDARGVDVALLYRPEAFTLLSGDHFRLRFPGDTTIRTRDILMAKGVLFGTDTVILFVNHWPSRRGGYAASQPRRNAAAALLRSKVDSVLKADADPMIIITGDFNDEPDKESLAGILKALPMASQATSTDLVNLMYTEKIRWDEGTIAYQGRWSIFDQFIVTGNMVKKDARTMRLQTSAGIFRAGFLVQKDERNLGDQLKRTYAGPRYLGGFSDHLPVFLDISKISK